MDWEGGGFINDRVSNEPQQLVNAVSVGSEERSKAIGSVSVSQINKLTRPNDGGLVIHGKKIYHVNLVAHICEVLDNNDQKIHIMVDDYTAGGPLEVSHIIGDTGVPAEDSSKSDATSGPDGPTKNVHQLAVGDYVRCIGVVKYNQDAPNVVAYHLQYVEDPNDITVHHLEVIRDSMFLEKNQGIMSSTGAAGKANPTIPHQVSKNNTEFGHLATREKIVLKYVQDKTDMGGDKGVHIKEIADDLKAFSRADIESSLTILNGEGLCWQGDTEDEWLANTAN